MCITFSDKAVNNWHSILNEAVQRSKVRAIIEAARQEYPDNEELGRAQRPYLYKGVVPKDLRPFGQEDASFFLQLLPPPNHDGLPESIRFWKTRIENGDGARSFRVGLIWGPVGCGKSSLVKAGILPRLANRVISVYVEATRSNTVANLAEALYEKFPALSKSRKPADLLDDLSHGWLPTHNQCLLIVLDQFEQWLQAPGQEAEAVDLLRALRKADGRLAQVLLIVRDDYWLRITRLFNSLEINLDRDRNIQLVDLFDQGHARHVLYLFGAAYRRFSDPDMLASEEEHFLDQAIDGLSQNGRVIPMHLSLFAEMMKSRSWTSRELQNVGGLERLGVTFFEENFSERAPLIPNTGSSDSQPGLC